MVWSAETLRDDRCSLTRFAQCFIDAEWRAVNVVAVVAMALVIALRRRPSPAALRPMRCDTW